MLWRWALPSFPQEDRSQGWLQQAEQGQWNKIRASVCGRKQLAEHIGIYWSCYLQTLQERPCHKCGWMWEPTWWNSHKDDCENNYMKLLLGLRSKLRHIFTCAVWSFGRKRTFPGFAKKMHQSCSEEKRQNQQDGHPPMQVGGIRLMPGSWGWPCPLRRLAQWWVSGSADSWYRWTVHGATVAEYKPS